MRPRTGTLFLFQEVRKGDHIAKKKASVKMPFSKLLKKEGYFRLSGNNNNTTKTQT